MAMAASSPPRSPFSSEESSEDLVDGVLPSLEESPLKRKRSGESSLVEKRTRRQDHHSAQEDKRLGILEKILRETFQHDSFRYEQQAAILSVVDGNNTLAVFPTGAGKSLCFQVRSNNFLQHLSNHSLIVGKLPAVAFEQLDEDTRRGMHGVTVVISPLIALIKDQVDGLKSKGITAGALDSTQTAQEQLETYRALDAGELKFLYCSPEKLNTKGFAKRLRRVPGGVRLLAVDEAHCVSEVRRDKACMNFEENG